MQHILDLAETDLRIADQPTPDQIGFLKALSRRSRSEVLEDDGNDESRQAWRQRCATPGIMDRDMLHRDHPTPSKSAVAN
ncbi:hypothetical protein ABBQ32_006370 [Trebouxia sp. C0010 RCD-2024]